MGEGNRRDRVGRRREVLVTGAVVLTNLGHQVGLVREPARTDPITPGDFIAHVHRASSPQESREPDELELSPVAESMARRRESDRLNSQPQKRCCRSRSAGVSVVLAVQDVTQFKDDDERSAIFSNCATYVSLAGASAASGTLLSDRLGEYRVWTMSLSQDPSRMGRSTSRSVETVPVLGKREIMSPPFGPRCGIVHVKAPGFGIPAAAMFVDLTLD